MVGLRVRYTVALLNVVGLTILYFFIPISTMVLVACIPAIVFSIVSNKKLLAVLSFLIFMIWVLILWAGIYFRTQLALVFTYISIALWLYSQIYPYEISVNLLGILPIQLIFVMALFILGIIMISLYSSRFNEFSMMVSFSMIVLGFSSIYLIVNVIWYFIPFMEALVFSNPITTWLFFILYVIVPFLTLNFMLLYIEMAVFSLRERAKYVKTLGKMKKIKFPYAKWIIKIGLTAILVCVVVTMLFSVIIM